ncbi:MAG: class I SAM-dependent methyltransferase [Terriglobales bacterium]|jgi:predicted O-methyltransferase YrrM
MENDVTQNAALSGTLSSTTSRTIRDARVLEVIERMQAERRRPASGSPKDNRAASHDPYDYADYGFSIHPEQGDLIYLLCRGMRATRVVEFATSIGMSTLYFAAAMRDNGGGTVIGSELVPAKVVTAKRNLAEAGLAEYAEIRQGDARQTLRDLGGPVDFALIDGWPLEEGPSLALQVIKIVAPQIRVGGYVMNDNAEPDFLEFVRDPGNGFLSVTLPIKNGTELSVKVA